jgi:hypothetical protein
MRRLGSRFFSAALVSDDFELPKKPLSFRGGVGVGPLRTGVGHGETETPHPEPLF